MQWKKLLCFYYVGIILFFFQGCAPTGGYGEFYQQNVFEKFPPTETVLVYQYSEESIKQLIKDGYSVIGVSTFNGAFTEQNKAINQAKEVGAQILLIGYKHTGSRQKIVPQTEYHPSQTATVQSYGSSNGNVNGYGGSASGHVSGQSTTYITLPGYTTTEYVPVTIERYDHLAIYLRKRK